MRIAIRDLLAGKVTENSEVTVMGWVRTRRDAKRISFLELSDGSSLTTLQVLVGEESFRSDILKNVHTGTALQIKGLLLPSRGTGQKWEVKVRELTVLGIADPATYPLQKKRHSDEFLRSVTHLRSRTNKFGAILRLRSQCAWAVHDFFRERHFFYVHTPIITGSNCEGAGKMFKVTTLPTGGRVEDDFFGKEAALTVSGQLEAELLALGLSQVYTFGPTFRAENSNTLRHAAEFWMVEPEMAFADLGDNMDLAEALIKYVVSKALNEAREDLAFFNKFVEPGLFIRLENTLTDIYVRLPYTEAIDILKSVHHNFKFEPVWGMDLQTEHERYLCEVHFKKPVIVYNYPATIKPFYMRLQDDGRTVAAMDILVPKVGELVGGSQREERLDFLEKRMDELGLDRQVYWWYLDTRRFGTVPHTGFGLGFERLLMMLTGSANIRDVIPFPRTPKNLGF